jgi:hypothetical protein
MRRTIQIFALMSLLAIVALPASAAVCKKAPVKTDTCLSVCNPDGRTSITVTAGLGTLDGFAQDGSDLTQLGVALVYPASNEISLLANWNHSETDWNSYGEFKNFDANIFTVGIRYYFGGD